MSSIPTGSDLGFLTYAFDRDNLSGVRRLQLNSFIRVAATLGIELSREDFRQDSDGYLSIDGMPADQWLDAMTTD